MEKIVDVAQYVYKYYLKETDEKIDEMKLQKLLYILQQHFLQYKHHLQIKNEYYIPYHDLYHNNFLLLLKLVHESILQNPH